jgi:ADP-ribose pyrophosphatase YjhB (NUDIX family)
MHHEVEYHFCPVCGGRLKSLRLKDMEPDRLVCSDFGYVFYLDPKLVACTVVQLDGRIVFLKRGIEPQRGKWVIPGGYVDRGEEIRAAARRETEEEVGIKTRIENLVGIYSYPGVMEVVVVYAALYLSGELIAGDETQEVKLYTPEEIPWSALAFRSTADALKDYCSQKNKKGVL